MTDKKPKTKRKSKGGRPTKYKPEFADKIVDWFIEQTLKGELPFFSKFAREVMNTHRESAINYTRKYPEFFDAYKKAKSIQKEFLITQALQNKFNPTFAIFTAKNITDMRDVKDLDVKVRTVDDIIKEIENG